MARVIDRNGTEWVVRRRMEWKDTSDKGFEYAVSQRQPLVIYFIVAIVLFIALVLAAPESIPVFVFGLVFWTLMLPLLSYIYHRTWIITAYTDTEVWKGEIVGWWPGVRLQVRTKRNLEEEGSPHPSLERV